MPLKRWISVASCISLSLLTGCEDRPISRQEVIGRYEYHLDNVRDKAEGTTCFNLRDDGTFTAGDTNFSSADGPTLPKTGNWVFRDSIGGPTLDLEHAGSHSDGIVPQ